MGLSFPLLRALVRLAALSEVEHRRRRALRHLLLKHGLRLLPHALHPLRLGRPPPARDRERVDLGLCREGACPPHDHAGQGPLAEGDAEGAAAAERVWLVVRHLPWYVLLVVGRLDRVRQLHLQQRRCPLPAPVHQHRRGGGWLRRRAQLRPEVLRACGGREEEGELDLGLGLPPEVTLPHRAVARERRGPLLQHRLGRREGLLGRLRRRRRSHAWLRHQLAELGLLLGVERVHVVRVRVENRHWSRPGGRRRARCSLRFRTLLLLLAVILLVLVRADVDLVPPRVVERVARLAAARGVRHRPRTQRRFWWRSTERDGGWAVEPRDARPARPVVIVLLQLHSLPLFVVRHWHGSTAAHDE
mmetsp:Transcript_14621/g.46944  ORF Transcript_14621/g.46944 Transcript_14621/m.46944 type:complete len:360 (+) Transcript_14621:202-1281(+)